MEEKKNTDLDTADSTPVTTDASTTTATPAPTEAVSTETASETTVPAAADVTATAESTTATETPVDATTDAAEAAPNAGAVSPVKQYAIAAIVIALMGGGLVFALEQQGRIDTGIFSFLTERSAGPVARVNGVAISSEQYEQNRNQILMSAQQQGIDVADPTVQAEIQTQAIDVLINTELLRQAAGEAGITADEAAIEARYQEIIANIGGEETLRGRMAELGISDESLRSDIEGELLVQSLLEGAVDTDSIEVTEDEIVELYEQAGGAEAGLPPLDDVRAEIESQIRLTEEQTLISEYIDGLRTEADIEILI